MSETFLTEDIEQRILVIRGQRVMLDADLAALYGVSTRHLNQQVRRNRRRFPTDFMFRLTDEESKKAVATSVGNHGGRRHRADVFTEPGAGMLSSVLRSSVTARAAVEILRAFARLRQEEQPLETPDTWRLRGFFAAIRDAVRFVPGDQEYITDDCYTYFIQAGDNRPDQSCFDPEPARPAALSHNDVTGSREASGHHQRARGRGVVPQAAGRLPSSRRMVRSFSGRPRLHSAARERRAGPFLPSGPESMTTIGQLRSD